MSRIRKAYETRFAWLLRHAHARRVNQGISWLVKRAEALSSNARVPLADGLLKVHQELARKPAFANYRPLPPPTLFFCDAGLGGLARWLRASGHDARWEAGIDDDELLAKARKDSATILTTDSMLMERRLLRDRIIPAFWMPPTLTIAEGLALVFREFNLPVRPPRCMRCGGELVRKDKELLKDRIPPRTYRWLDEYFVCGRCGNLFWHGTHWNRIQHQLESLKTACTRAT